MNRYSSSRLGGTRTTPRRPSVGGPRADGGASAFAPLMDRLAAIGATPHWVVSCYLKLEPRDRGHGKYLIKLKNRAKRLLADLDARGLGRAARAQVARDLERIREALAHPAELPPGRGVAVFASEPLRLFEVIPLPRVFRSRLVVDHSPLVRELAALDNEFGRVICAAYDRTSARFFEVTAGGVRELPSLSAGDTSRTSRFHGPAKARARRGRGDRGGVNPSAPGEHNFNQRIREEKQRHYANVAQRLFELTRATPVRGVVLAGTGADVAAVATHLHPYVADALLGTARLNPKAATETDVLESVLELREGVERDWERRHRRELEEGIGTGWALNGVTATLEALARGQVRTLLVDSVAERPGYRCAGSGRLAVSPEGCGGDGAAEPVPDVLDEAIEEALRQGAHVEVVEDREVQRHVDGLACLLRFRVG